MIGFRRLLAGVLMLAGAGESLLAQQGGEADEQAAVETTELPSGPPPGIPAPTAAAAADRTRLNLLGEVDTNSGEGRRNENVSLTLIDNNVLKELNERLGASATIIDSMKPEQSYWGTEYGGPPTRPLHLPPSKAPAIHGNLFWTHNNSAFSARSFFQVGRVQPARSNNYGFNVGAPLWDGAALTVDGSQTRNRGQVNGNVLVPAADERTPLTEDPRLRPIVQRILNAYPAETPNRTDINPRALNTNSPQDINNDRIAATLDQSLRGDSRLTARYSFVTQKVDAFQLVGGQNPDTTTRNHRSRLTWSRAWSAALTTDFSVGFDRVGSLLIPDESSLGPWYRTGNELNSIGPPGRFPVDRAGNNFRYAARSRYVTGNHSLSFGFELLRGQINGSEVQDHRGRFIFRRNFGRDAITNLRLGTAVDYSVAIGDVHRGFRIWKPQLYLGDEWKATADLTLSLGLRWEPVTAPTEVDNLTEIPYDSDMNNFAPRFGFAYRLPGRWGALRGAYGLHYGEIFTATYIQARINPPSNITITVQSPDLADPLQNLTPADLDPSARSGTFDISPELSTPYSHTYNFSWEFDLAKEWTVDLGYVGNRSHKLLAMWFLNRARPVEGIPLTSATINERRPDPRFFDVQHVTNGSRSYYDAGRATLRAPNFRGWTIDASYWWSKAIDLGGSYLNTASNANRSETQSPSELDNHGELRGLSNFDQPHAMLVNASYLSPSLAGRRSWMRAILGSWQTSVVFLLKAGTPFTVLAGSDGPGFGNVDGSQSDRPNLVDLSILGASVDDPDLSSAQLPAAAFEFMDPTQTAGTLGRNTFRRDGIANVNMALSKRWGLGGDRGLLLRAEALNLTNHPQFAEPGTNLTQGNFGRITNTLNDGRTFRFTLRFLF